MRTEQTKIVLTCDNCRVTSEQRDNAPIEQIWFKFKSNYTGNLSLKYDALFCTESCGKEFIKKQSSFEEVPKNALYELLRPNDKYEKVIGNTD